MNKDQAWEQILDWLDDERVYRKAKWEGHDEDLAGGLDDGANFWDNGVLNYTGRVRLLGLDHPLGLQALMKLISTLTRLAELAIVEYGPPPKGGLPSGELN